MCFTKFIASISHHFVKRTLTWIYYLFSSRSTAAAESNSKCFRTFKNVKDIQPGISLKEKLHMYLKNFVYIILLYYTWNVTNKCNNNIIIIIIKCINGQMSKSQDFYLFFNCFSSSSCTLFPKKCQKSMSNYLNVMQPTNLKTFIIIILFIISG